MSIYIISSIILLLVLMAGYVFISHAMEKRRIYRQRLLTALKVRQRNFRYMITGFPPHFLTNDLMALVYRALIETCEQLSKLETNDPQHAEDVQLYSSQLLAIKQHEGAKRIRLENPEQIKEIRQHLQELYRFVAQQEGLKVINKVQAAAFADQIKRLAVQSAIDGYVFQARKAEQAGKAKLAIHFYGLAGKFLVPENTDHSYDHQIAQLSEAIAKLEEATRAEQAAPEGSADGDQEGVTTTGSTSGPISKEWEKFGSNEDEWKKKQVYD